MEASTKDKKDQKDEQAAENGAGERNVGRIEEIQGVVIARGAEVLDTGGPITVPVGKVPLGRIFNLLGEAIDQGEKVEVEERWPIHRSAPTVEDLTPTT